MFYNIIRYLIGRPRLSNLILIFIILVAGAALFQIKRMGYPRVSFDKMRITTVYPGASPEDVELNVTIKLEDALKEVYGIEKYTSRSVENLSVIDVKIDSDAEDKKEVKANIRRVIEGVTDLPGEITDKSYIFDVTVDNMKIYGVVLLLPDGDRRRLRRLGRELKRMVLDNKEISRVYDNGIPDREFMKT